MSLITYGDPGYSPGYIPNRQYIESLRHPRKEQIMTRDELIAQCNIHLGAAHGCILSNQPEHYVEHMSLLRELLNNQPELEAGGATETPPAEGPR